MKRLFTLGMLIGFITMSYGQKLAIYNVAATAEDYVLLLETKGYMTFAFDVTSLKDATYWIEPVIQHYQQGKLVPNSLEVSIQFSSRDMLPTKNEAFVEKMRKAGRIYDEAQGILSLCEKIRVGFAPSSEENIRLMRFFVTDKGNFTIPLLFEPQIDLKTGIEAAHYSYGYLPFVVDEIVFDQFIPLALCGAYWYDERSESFRFCGESVLTKEMTEDILKDIKEYYIIGIKVHR